MLELRSSSPSRSAFDAFTDIGFWTSVGIIAGTYTIFTLGLQLNVGFTGIFNFGQAGFMAIGAYSMAILVTETGSRFWLSLPLAILITIAFGCSSGCRRCGCAPTTSRSRRSPRRRRSACSR